MAVFAIRTVAELDDGIVLAPERYDPRRDQLDKLADENAVYLQSMVDVIQRTWNPKACVGQSCIVLDTSNAKEGIICGVRPSIEAMHVGSMKKIIQPNDVIISRLRPYLRQVAFVDSQIPFMGDDVLLVCSTEFYVLRSKSKQSIAFLVPFLLSQPVQAVLAAAQEGGHHPRIDDETLLSLPVPMNLVEKRDDISAQVEGSVRAYRQSEQSIITAIQVAEMCFG